MSGPADLIAVARGEATAMRALLQHCRFEGFGGEAYGGEAIASVLRRHAPLAEPLATLRCAQAQAVIGRDTDGAAIGLFADCEDGWITRLRRLGPAGEAMASTPATAVPADADMDQRGATLRFAPDAHPALDLAHAPRIAALGERWLAEQPGAIVGDLDRARVIVLRAASAGAECVALLRVQGRFAHGLGGFMALALFGDGDPAIVIDEAGRAAAARAPWEPTLR